MPDDLPTWAFLLTHTITAVMGGVGGAWAGGRGDVKQGQADMTKADTERIQAMWDRIDAPLDADDVKWLYERGQGLIS